MKNPPPAALTISERDLVVLPVASPLYRVTFTADEHATPFGRLRTWGPSTNGRWDPHPGVVDADGRRRGAEGARGVLYTAQSIATALAEVYQDESGHHTADSPRFVDLVADRPALYVWRTTRDLRLLDLTGEWALRQGASVSLDSAPRDTGQEWARAIADAADSLDGLWVRPTMTGEAVIGLYAPAITSFPARPELGRLLADPTLRGHVEAAANRIGYVVSDGDVVRP